MTKYTKRLLPLLLLALVLVLAACGQPAQPAAGTDTGGESAAGADATGEDAAGADAGEEAAAEEETAAEEEAPLDFSEARSLDDVADINSFRMRVVLEAEGDALTADSDLAMMAGGLSIESALVKEPAAQHVSMSIGGAEMGMAVEFLTVDGKAYGKMGDQWVESSIEQMPNLDELILIKPQDMGEDINKLERVGNETLNGREVVHLRGDKAMMASMEESDSSGLLDAENVQFDMWIDRKDGFVVKMEVLAEGKGISETDPDAEGKISFVLEYYDFNADIEITAPEDVMTTP